MNSCSFKAGKVQTNVLLTTKRHGPMWRAVAVSQNQSADAEQGMSLLMVPFRPTVPLFVSPRGALASVASMKYYKGVE